MNFLAEDVQVMPINTLPVLSGLSFHFAKKAAQVGLLGGRDDLLEVGAR